MNAELQKVRRSIAEIERKLESGNLSDSNRALATRALRLVRMNEETLMLQALNAYERPDVLQ